MSAPVASTVDLDRIRIRPAPRREPPYEDPCDRHAPQLRLVGPLDRPLPFEVSHPVRRPRPRPLVRPDLPDPAGWSHRLLTGLAESAAGRRPMQQLSGLLTPAVSYGLSQDFEKANRSRRRHWIATARVRRVRASQPSETAAEVSATVQVGARVRAVALRLEEHRGGWRCTRLQLG